jgi:deoxycytidylate deaminase
MKDPLKWPSFAMRLAFTAAAQSEDPYWQVGACILRLDHSVASLGFNGPPPGIDIDWSNREARRPLIIHAEKNALRYVTPADELDFIAVTTMPCGDCITNIASYRRLRRVYYCEPYDRDGSAVIIAAKFGITLTQLKLPEREIYP